MRIGIYNAPAGEGLGGAEFCSALMAETFAAGHDVEIVHHKQGLDAARLEEMFSVDLRGCSLRYVEKVWPTYATSPNPFARYRDAKRWQSQLSAPYDVFCIFTQDIPPFCHARHGLLVVLFANYGRDLDAIDAGGGHPLVRAFKRLYHHVEWNGRMAGYQRKTAISEFSRAWTKRRWDIDCEIFHPPAADPVHVTDDKRPMILSIGRFATHGHLKRQGEMMGVFRDLVRDGLEGWQFTCVGNLTDAPQDRAFFDRVVELGRDCGGVALANLQRAELDALSSTASIYWHAAGYAIDESLHPEKVEHYGISTVEAMACGCIPVVIDRGGQREIVEHGFSGFLWETLDELRHYTDRLIHDATLRRTMQRAAMTRAAALSRAAFVARAHALVDPMLQR